MVVKLMVPQTSTKLDLGYVSESMVSGNGGVLQLFSLNCWLSPFILKKIEAHVDVPRG